MSISLILGHCNGLIEILGDYLALLITFPLGRDANVDMFFLMCWKKGEVHYVGLSQPLRLVVINVICPVAKLRSSGWGAYAYVSFLTEEHSSFPTSSNALKIFSGSSSMEETTMFRASSHCADWVSHRSQNTPRSSVRLGCSAEPNSTGSGPSLIPPPSIRPSRSRATDTIFLFNLLFEEADPPLGYFYPETRPFTFIVHRHALIALILPAQRACAPSPSDSVAAPTLVPWHVWGVQLT